MNNPLNARIFVVFVYCLDPNFLIKHINTYTGKGDVNIPIWYNSSFTIQISKIYSKHRVRIKIKGPKPKVGVCEKCE